MPVVLSFRVRKARLAPLTLFTVCAITTLDILTAVCRHGAQLPVLVASDFAGLCPSLYILSAGVLVTLFDLAGSCWLVVMLSMIMIWLTVLLGNLNIRFSKWVSASGSCLKVLVVAVMSGLALLVYQRHGAANPLTLSSVLPSQNSLGSGLKFLPALVFNRIGCELMLGLNRDSRNPQRDMPVAIFWSATIVTDRQKSCKETGWSREGLLISSGLRKFHVV